MTVGIVCEYNPFHLGHLSQIRQIREIYGAETTIVCAMSGNFVQRGAPAIVDKSLRARCAMACGADLVLELPITTVLSSAEGFAAGSVAILAPLCDVLCCGAETGDSGAITATAQALLSPQFPSLLREALARGISFPAARTAALEKMGLGSSLLTQPNNILAVEYAKAISATGTPMTLLPISRPGSYHAQIPDPQAPSATAIRQSMERGENWQTFVPAPVARILSGATMHTLAAGERAILARLRTMTEDEFSALPYGSEGLWRRFFHASRQEATLEAILTATKSKRYTRSRLDRMAMCAFLGITDLHQECPYTRVLAFSHRGRALLANAKGQGRYLNAGESFPHPYWEMECRCTDLFALFAVRTPEPPGAEERYRIFYQH